MSAGGLARSSLGPLRATRKKEEEMFVVTDSLISDFLLDLETFAGLLAS
jgi:hypothetical protein